MKPTRIDRPGIPHLGHPGRRAGGFVRQSYRVERNFVDSHDDRGTLMGVLGGSLTHERGTSCDGWQFCGGGGSDVADGGVRAELHLRRLGEGPGV